jgi:hypothetical protein
MNTADQGYEVAKRVRAAKSWLVRCGTNVVGPVSIELIERGLEAGKIPADAQMSGEGRGDWRPLAEVFAVPAPRPVTGVFPVAVARHEPRPTPEPRFAPVVPLPIPPAPISVRYADEPISIPKQGMVASLFG